MSTVLGRDLSEDMHRRDCELALARLQLERQRGRLRLRLVESGGVQGIDILSATSGQGETEHVNIEIERAVTASLDAHTRGLLEEVAAALTRIDDGTYGQCVECGGLIPAERIMARPETRYCVSCARVQERA